MNPNVKLTHTTSAKLNVGDQLRPCFNKDMYGRDVFAVFATESPLDMIQYHMHGTGCNDMLTFGVAADKRVIFVTDDVFEKRKNAISYVYDMPVNMFEKSPIPEGAPIGHEWLSQKPITIQSEPREMAMQDVLGHKDVLVMTAPKKIYDSVIQGFSKQPCMSHGQMLEKLFSNPDVVCQSSHKDEWEKMLKERQKRISTSGMEK